MRFQLHPSYFYFLCFRDCPAHALRVINLRPPNQGRLSNTMVRPIPSGGVLNFFSYFLFFLLEVDIFSFLFILKSNDISVEIRNVIAYHINMI